MNKLGVLASVVLITASIGTGSAYAQGAAAYQTRFDSAAGWDLGEFYGVQWGVDATPVPGFSATNCLNYNDGTDYATGGYVYGFAMSPSINIAGSASAALQFRCRYQTEDPTLSPANESRDVRFLYVMDSTGEILASIEFTAGLCGSMNAWHSHELTLNPTWGAVRLVFGFDSVDANYNNYQGWFIDDLVVEIPDTAPPAIVNDLAAASPTSTSLVLSWTAPSDDDVSGEAGSFDLRYSTSVITEANWAMATPVSGEPAPGIAGTGHEVTVSGLSPGTLYHFALKTTDKSGNVSGLSNSATGTTLAAGATPTPPQVFGAGALSEEETNRLPCSAGAVHAPSYLTGLAAVLGVLALRRRRS